MRKAKTLAVITLMSGVVELDKDQVKRRQHNIQRIGKTGNRYEIIKPVQFKAGETLGMEMIPKSFYGVLDFDGKDSVAAKEEHSDIGNLTDSAE